MSVLRPRCAYRVEQVINVSSEVHWDLVTKMEARRIQIVAVRVARDAVPPRVRIHAWKWDKHAADAGSVLR
jgi:hypothetical protein